MALDVKAAQQVSSGSAKRTFIMRAEARQDDLAAIRI